MRIITWSIVLIVMTVDARKAWVIARMIGWISDRLDKRCWQEEQLPPAEQQELEGQPPPAARPRLVAAGPRRDEFRGADQASQASSPHAESGAEAPAGKQRSETGCWP